jgi:hypothetical protein
MNPLRTTIAISPVLGVKVISQLGVFSGITTRKKRFSRAASPERSTLPF